MNETLDNASTGAIAHADPAALQTLDTSKMPQGILGPNNEVPMACAVFQVDIDETAGVATDARYVYASQEYRQATSRSKEGLIGRSHLEIGEVDADEWLAMCYRVVAEGEAINGFVYDPLIRDWICYRLAPSAAEGCCVYTFINVVVDEQQRERIMATVEARTSHFVSAMLSALSAEQSYEAAMNGMLTMMSQVIHTDRLCIFECYGKETKVTFELCSEGIPSLVGTIFPLPKEGLQRWFRTVSKNPVTLVPDISILERFSPPLYEWCQVSDVQSLMAAPFFIDGEIVGFLGAYNYRIDETIDLNRVFAAVSTFIATRITNRRLIDSLEWASCHDALTDLLDRRGSEMAIAKLISNNPDSPYAMVLIDIDDFKLTNDGYGHNAGDEALKALAVKMTREFPEESVFARNGGDEFLVMLVGDSALRANELIGDFLQSPLTFEFEGESHELTVSIGYSCYPDQATNARKLYSKADIALYAVKHAGKAGFAKYSPEMDAD